jgi:hypothetical protein
LFARITWLESGKELLRQGMYRYLAVHWRSQKVQSPDKGAEIWAPCELKEVGFVNDIYHREHPEDECDDNASSH